jgi:hypothetical protein
MALMQNPAAEQQGTPPMIPGLTQLPSDQGAGQSPMLPPGAGDSREQIPQLIAAIVSVLQNAAESGPEVFDAVSNMAVAYSKQLKKQMGFAEQQQQPQGAAAPPMGTPPPQAPAPGGPQGGAPGEDPRAAFLAQLMQGGQR